MLTFKPDERVLFKLPHGLGDAVQFTIVMEHLKERYPETQFDIVTNRGKASHFPSDLVTNRYDDLVHVDLSVYDQVYLPPMYEVVQTFSDYPSTKPYLTLRDDFGIEPTNRPYRIHWTDKDQELVDAYIATLPPAPFALIHYEGNSATRRKNLKQETVSKVVRRLLASDMTPVILDWDNRSPLVDQKTVYCPGKVDPIWKGKATGEASTIAALISRAEIMIGIDSGPEHVAAATQTPLIVCWTYHHPLHFFDCSGDVFHLVPKRHFRMIKGDRKVGYEYFQENYEFSEYDQLDESLLKVLDKRLKPRKQASIPCCQCSGAGYCPLFNRQVDARDHALCKRNDEKGLKHRTNCARENGML